MAISYDLTLATTSTAAEVARQLTAVARPLGLYDASVTAEAVLDEGKATTRGTWIRVFAEDPRPDDPVITDLGFTPSVGVVFRFRKHGFDAQDDDMVRLVAGLLDRVPGDAVLHFQYEDIWLLRRDGALSVSEDTEHWPAHRLALLPKPYRRATYAFSAE